MNRLRWLLPLLAVLALANLAWLTWMRWGLITINSDDQPLSEIVRQIQKQGGIALRTNLDPTTKINMHVTRVPLTEALETLAAVTDARWSLTYLLGPDKGAIAGALNSYSAGQQPEGWKLVYLPVPPNLGSEAAEVPPDPRRDTWAVKTPAEPTLQAYLQDAGMNVSAAFAAPEAWNPKISKKLSSGEVRSLVPKLATAAGGKYEEIFFLQGNGRRGDNADGPPDGGPRRGGFDREAMATRMQAEIAKLPASERPAAQKEFDDRKAFFTGLAGLTDDQRRQKMEDFFSNPDTQAKMEDREAQRDARRTPEQRVQRYKRYAERKEAIKNGTAPTGGGGGGGGRGPWGN